MTNTNSYFEEMERQGREAKATGTTPDHSQGQLAAYWAWAESCRRQSDELECERLPWPYEMEDFSKALREAGIKTLAVTDHSTGLMEGLHLLDGLGWKIDGICTVTRANDKDYDGQGFPPKKIQGIRLRAE